MKASLRIALTLFSYQAVQSWVILVCAIGAVIGVLVRVYDVTGVFVTFLLMSPAFFGGMALRTISSPTALHLLPYGRRRMLLGATGTITLVALIWTTPVTVFQLLGLRTPDGSSMFDLPPPGTFLSGWGVTALVWVWSFFASRHRYLFGFSWIPFGLTIQLIGQLHLRPDLRANVLFVAGAVAWVGLALWYLQTPSVMRPFEASDRARGGPRRPRIDQAPVPRPLALHKYLAGTWSLWPQVLTGTAITLLWLVVNRLLDGTNRELPVDYLLFISFASFWSSPQLVRRARLVWLRAGLDRAGLFAATERHALRAMLALLGLPTVILVATSLVQRPDLTAAILLFAATQWVVSFCFLQAGLAETRGVNLETVLVFGGLVVLFLVMSITLQPYRGAYLATYLATIAVFGGLALLLRRSASRAWRTLDWRVAGPLPDGIGPQRDA